MAMNRTTMPVISEGTRMSSTAAKSRHITAHWTSARRLYPIYVALAIQFELGSPPFKSLDGIKEISEPEVIERVEEWLAEMDERIQVYQFRELLQTSGMAAKEDKLQSLIERHLHKENKSESDRDKVDFLLTQYFAICAPPSFHDREVSLEDVADVLEPILGESSTEPPDFLTPLEAIIGLMQGCKSLRDLKVNRIIEQGRVLKLATGEMYFGSAVLLAFARFNYLVRRSVVRLINADLQAIEEGVRQLESRGITTVDCTAAKMTSQETTSNLRKTCQQLRKPFGSDYSGDQSLEQLMGLRAAIDQALEPRTNSRELEARVEQLCAEVAELRALLGEVLAGIGGNVAQSSTSSEANVSASPVARTAAPSASSTLPADLEGCVKAIKAELLARADKRGTQSSVVAGTTLLTAGEVSAFLDRANDAPTPLQTAVAARVLLIGSLEVQKRTGQSPSLKTSLEIA